MQYIAFDVHKRYTVAVVEEEQGRNRRHARIDHDDGAFRTFLSRCELGSPVALETTGNWYWIVDQIEAAGMSPRLVNALKAKHMLGSENKTDRLDAQGLNVLQRSGTLPTVWIPPAPLRDLRELFRTRMVVQRISVRLKNRILATYRKYNLSEVEVADRFGKRGQELLRQRLSLVPPYTRLVLEELFEQLNHALATVKRIEKRMQESFATDERMSLLESLPGVGSILGAVILSEIGDISRFPSASHFAAYAGTTPRVYSSGDRTHYGHTQVAVNHYLKWAFAEAANVICMNHHRWPHRHVCRLYLRLRARKGHGVAIGAVARHLAEATFHVLSRKEVYREPSIEAHSSTRG